MLYSAGDASSHSDSDSEREDSSSDEDELLGTSGSIALSIVSHEPGLQRERTMSMLHRKSFQMLSAPVLHAPTPSDSTQQAAHDTTVSQSDGSVDLDWFWKVGEDEETAALQATAPTPAAPAAARPISAGKYRYHWIPKFWTH